MTEAALIIALLLNRPVGLVKTVYDMAGLSGVCVVEYESQFNEHAWCKEARGGTSYGLFQLYDKYHPQYRDDLLLHLVYGAEFWKACLEKANGGAGRMVVNRPLQGPCFKPMTSAPSIAVAYSYFNSGNSRTSIIKGKAVEAKYNSLAMYLWRRTR